MPSLEYLPPPIVSRIATYLECRSEVLALALTCRRLTGPAYDVLYLSIDITNLEEVLGWSTHFQLYSEHMAHVRQINFNRGAFSSPSHRHVDEYGVPRHGDVDVWALLDVYNLFDFLSPPDTPHDMKTLRIADAECFAANCHWSRSLDAIFQFTTVSATGSGIAFEALLRQMVGLETVMLERLNACQQQAWQPFDIDDIMDGSRWTLRTLTVTGDVTIPSGPLQILAFPSLTSLHLQVADVNIVHLMSGCASLTDLTIAGTCRVVGSLPGNYDFRLSSLTCSAATLDALSGFIVHDLTLVESPTSAPGRVPSMATLTSNLFRDALRAAQPVSLRVVGWTQRLAGLDLTNDISSVEAFAFAIDTDIIGALRWFGRVMVPVHVARVHITFPNGGVDTESLMFQGIIECVQSTYGRQGHIWLTIDTYRLEETGTIRTHLRL